MYTPVFYDDRMNVDGLASYSPSAGKPKRFVELLAHYDYRSYGPDKLGTVIPVSVHDLRRVHSHDYVGGVFSGSIVNGFENNDLRVAEACLWTVGSLLSAARHAIKHPATPVCSPTSGFHHAHREYGGGFCTFNGLMVVASKLINEAVGDFKVAVLDCDFHTGDGTMAILDDYPGLDSKVMHLTAGALFHGDYPKSESIEFQQWLEASVAAINDFRPDLVLYQAGADPHINDPLGGFLNDDGMMLRDATVFCGIKAPLVWNLAGGYQRSKDGTIFTDPVLQIHYNTLLESDKSVKTREQWFGEST